MVERTDRRCVTMRAVSLTHAAAVVTAQLQEHPQQFPYFLNSKAPFRTRSELENEPELDDQEDWYGGGGKCAANYKVVGCCRVLYPFMV